MQLVCITTKPMANTMTDTVVLIHLAEIQLQEGLAIEQMTESAMMEKENAARRPRKTKRAK